MFELIKVPSGCKEISGIRKIGFVTNAGLLSQLSNYRYYIFVMKCLFIFKVTVHHFRNIARVPYGHYSCHHCYSFSSPQDVLNLSDSRKSLPFEGKSS